MPSFTATDKSGVIDFLIESFTNDPRLAYVVDYVPPGSEDMPPEFSCVYRAPNGAKCAFGRCVTDEELSNPMGIVPEDRRGSPRWYEGLGATGVIECLRTRAVFEDIGGVAIEGSHFWDSLQQIHDQVALLIENEDGIDPPRWAGTDIPQMLRKWRELDYPQLVVSGSPHPLSLLMPS